SMGSWRMLQVRSEVLVTDRSDAQIKLLCEESIPPIRCKATAPIETGILVVELVEGSGTSA
ncbi:MAG: hypothetical protein ABIY71_10305, partial [Flavobacteriales bacterium]